MNNKISITKKSIWELPSVAVIIAAVGTGCNTTQLIVKKSKKKPALFEINEAEEIGGMISQGTYNKYRNRLEHDGIIKVMNKDDINKRKGKGYQFELNYNRLCNQLESVFKEELKITVGRLHNSLVFITERINLLEKRKKAYELLLEKTKKQSQPKQTYDISKEDFIDKPHNLGEINSIKEIIEKISSSIKSYNELTLKANLFIKENIELLERKWQFSDWEIREITRILNTYFFWRIVTNDNSFTLNSVFKELIEEVKSGELRDLGFFNLGDKFKQVPEGNMYQVISKNELPNLFNIFKYYKKLNEFRMII